MGGRGFRSRRGSPAGGWRFGPRPGRRRAGREGLESIILKAAELLGVEPDTLDEVEARKILMRTENPRMHKARDDVIKKQTS